MFTFAVVGRDESQRLATAVGHALDAAREGDAVWFVDSGSTDGSVELARSLGVRVLQAPEGKGRAVAHALGEVTTEYVVLVDADVDRSSENIPLRLREAAELTRADLVVAQFDEPRKGTRYSSRFVWTPLVAALFPEVAARFGRTPLSGFRALRTGLDPRGVPGGFGIEAHVNLAAAAGGGTVSLADVGTYWGPIRRRPLLGSEVGAAILDQAQAHGRLAAARRPLWDRWLAGVVDLVVERAPLARVRAAAERPMPPAGVRTLAPR